MNTNPHSYLSCPSTRLPSPQQFQQILPLSFEQRQFILQTREALIRILDGIDPRLILIVGPCSVHNIAATLDYAKRLRTLAEEVSDRFLILMRAHYEKPRSRTGWKGMLYDPYLNGSDDLHTGLLWTRGLLLQLTNLQIPLSTEFLDPTLTPYFSDLICWGQIGARTSESQLHRQMASGLPMPIGFKNRTDGCIQVAVNAVVAAHQPQSYFGVDDQHHACRIQTAGNPYCHVVLRGGKQGPNWDLCSIAETAEALRAVGQTPRILIDCAHDNCKKVPHRQAEIFEQVIEITRKHPSLIAGVMLESYLEKGSQTHHPDPSLIDPSVSITDPCLGWSCTEALIRKAYYTQSTREFTPHVQCK